MWCNGWCTGMGYGISRTPLSTHVLGISAMTDWLEIRIICSSGATCLYIHGLLFQGARTIKI